MADHPAGAGMVRDAVDQQEASERAGAIKGIKDQRLGDGEIADCDLVFI